MIVISSTLKEQWDTWDDPGDYPSNAGSGPLPSVEYVSEVTGEVICKPEATDLITILQLDNGECDPIQEFFKRELSDNGLSCKVKQWSYAVHNDGTIHVTVEEVGETSYARW
jgi:hypothetical protein